MGNLKTAITRALKKPDETTIAAVIEAAQRTLTAANIDKQLPLLMPVLNKAMTSKNWEPALALAAVIDAVSPENLEVLRRVAECLQNIGDNTSALGIADRIYAAATDLADRIQAQHLTVKLLAQWGGRLDEAREGKENLGTMIQRLIEADPAVTLDQWCWVMGSLFWFAGYFDDDPADRSFINQVSSWAQGKVTQCI